MTVNIRLAIFYAVIGASVMTSCNQIGKNNSKWKEMSLDPRYHQVDKIKSFADCTGPHGKYTTELVSDRKGNLFFSQFFQYKDSPFVAKLSSDNHGQVLDEKGNVVDTLSNNAMEMIRSHDFHRLQTEPFSFFNHIKFEKDLESVMELYSAMDRLNHPVKILYDKKIKQIRTIELLNMMDTTEVISISYKKWVESDYGKLAKEIEILQADKDTFHFNFTKIEINQ